MRDFRTDLIHHTGYLLAYEVNLEELEEDITALFQLKAGYEIIDVSIEVVKEGTGTVDLGLDMKLETGDLASDFFLNDIDLAAKESFKSKIVTTIKENANLILDTTSREGIIKVRVHYFTESKMIK